MIALEKKKESDKHWTILPQASKMHLQSTDVAGVVEQNNFHHVEGVLLDRTTSVIRRLKLRLYQYFMQTVCIYSNNTRVINLGAREMIKAIKDKKNTVKSEHAENTLCPVQQCEETIDTVSIQLVINHNFMIIFLS